jgi:hypothetical protein
MDHVWKTVGEYAGIGGIALIVVLIVFREVIRMQKLFTPVTRTHSYQLLNKIITYTCIIGIVGIVAYTIISLFSGRVNFGISGPTPSPTPALSNNLGNVQPPSQNELNSENSRKGQTPTPHQVTSSANNAVQAPSPSTNDFILSSRVFDEERNPVSGAKVSLIGFPGQSVETKDNGSFVFSGVSAKLNDRVRIHIECSGYATKDFEVIVGKRLDMFYLERIK